MRVAVYCSAKDSIADEYLQLGRDLGKWLAESGHSLVYGGATGGLMSRVSQAYRATIDSISHGEEQKIIGVIPSRIIASGRKADNCDELIVVDDMAERKRKMREIADCFVCLPGSYGTLDEMFDVIASGTVGEHKKPIYILNYKGFYDGLIQERDRMRLLKFLPQQESYLPHFADTLEEIEGLITK